MKLKLTFLFLLFCYFNSLGQILTNSSVDSTVYYSFHIDYWVNLHHFLYQKAKGSQIAKLQEDGLEFQDIGESDIYASLSKHQRQQLDNSIKFYAQNLIQKDLLRDLGEIRVWLQNHKNSHKIKDTLISREYTDILNNASEVYKNTFWPVHKSHNLKVLQKHIDLIKDIESPVIPKIEKLSLNKWPANSKVRIDLTVYGNYAGAYTPSRPRMNIFISTIDPRALTLSFVETIFHEGSHLLFNYGGPWRGGITEIFEQNKLAIDYPIHLWHASLFYLCGKICKEEFSKKGFDDYIILMFDRNIFSEYRKDKHLLTLNRYYADKITFAEAITEMLNYLK
ncbi:hypothetical protein [Fulvivirga lutimaris]|uniref:hypothetical protein n=1 Tax=Fulvivirga lutimaris TaxID=1819566 RepID=UPI0012BC7444|nr:hypothetical protein [Fulvivirga lutimaris]MTI40824.1 hypothetical protein [Fulvivirga lutimaris]